MNSFIKTHLKYLIFITFALMILIPLTFLGLKFYFQHQAKSIYEHAIKKYPMKYTYFKINGEIEQPLYGVSLKEGEKLYYYYEELKILGTRLNRSEKIVLESGKVTYRDIPKPVFNFMDIERPVYISDTLLNGKVYECYVFDVNCWGYFKAYFPIQILHDTLPTQSKKELKELTKKFLSPSYNWESRLSPFGFYCN